jgi:hypothetical protein
MELRKIINSTNASSPFKGQLAYSYAAKQISKSKPAVISFSEITECTSAFCNSFVGKLYMNFDNIILSDFLQITDVNNDIWAIKINDAITLGSNEKIRNIRKQSLENLQLC